MSHPALRLAALGLTLALALGAAVGEGELPYESFRCDTLPVVEKRGETGPTAQFPDWQGGLLRRAEYQEYRAAFDESYAFVTCRAAEELYLSLLHYTPALLCYVPHQGLPLPLDHETTLSFRLPREDGGGVTRLVAWRTPPPRHLLERLASRPEAANEPLAGVIDERWFSRAEPAGLPVPWEDPSRPFELAPLPYAASAYPACRAYPTTGLTVRAKDCAVSYSGLPALGFDDYGSFGQWTLDWTATLWLQLELPARHHYSQAELYLSGTYPGGISASPPPLAVTVNGWWLAPYAFQPAYPAGTQPTGVDVSPYLQAGSNTIEIRLDTFSDAQWLLDNIELWVQ